MIFKKMKTWIGIGKTPSSAKHSTVPPIEEQIRGWDDKECLQNFMKFIPRVGLGTDLIQDEHGFMTHKVLQIQCGDFVITSPPLELDWPLEPVVFPEEHKGRLN